MWPLWRDWRWRQRRRERPGGSRWAQAGRAVVLSVDGRSGASPAAVWASGRVEGPGRLQETAVVGRVGLGAWGAEGRACRPPGCGAAPGEDPRALVGPGAACLLMGLVPPPSGQPSPQAREPPSDPAPSQQHSPPVPSRTRSLIFHKNLDDKTFMLAVFFKLFILECSQL